MNLRTLKRSVRRSTGAPEKNAHSPKNARGKRKGPARVSRAEYQAHLRIAAMFRKAKRAAQVRAALEAA